MSADFAVDVIRGALTIILTVAGPLLLAALVIGVLVSFVQAITQIQEQTLTFIPKLLTIGALGLILLPWILNHLVTYLVGIFSTISLVGS